jgi:hypothetical protein
VGSMFCARTLLPRQSSIVFILPTDATIAAYSIIVG